MRVQLGPEEEGRTKVVDGTEYLITKTKYAQMWWIGDDGTILHRENGPAVIWADGKKTWYLNGNQLTEQEFNKILIKKRLKRL